MHEKRSMDWKKAKDAYNGVNSALDTVADLERHINIPSLHKLLKRDDLADVYDNIRSSSVKKEMLTN